MTKSIIDVLDLAGNGKDKDSSVEVKNENSKYLDYRRARDLINKFLACDREVLVLTRVPGYTVVELAKALSVKPYEIIRLRTMTETYWLGKRNRLNLKLITLHLNTKFYRE